MGTTVDLSPALSQLLGVVVTLLGLVGTWAALQLKSYLAAKTGVNIAITNDQIAASLDRVLYSAAHMALDKLNDEHVTTVDTRNAAIAAAVNFAIANAGPMLAKLGITEDALADMVRAKLRIAEAELNVNIAK